VLHKQNFTSSVRIVVLVLDAALMKWVSEYAVQAADSAVSYWGLNLAQIAWTTPSFALWPTTSLELKVTKIVPVRAEFGLKVETVD